MDFRKIKQYEIGSLVKIVAFKIARDLALLGEKYRLRMLLRKDITQRVRNVKINLVENIELALPPQKSLIHAADEIIKGNIYLFDKYYHFGGWLKDPISEKKWPSDVFFADAKTKLEGYGDVKYVLELNKLNHVVIIAAAYYHTGNNKYIYYVKQNIKYWQDEVKYERSVANKIIMDVAFRCINLVFISLLCGGNEIFKKEIYPVIHEILILSERQMRKFCTPRWFKTGNGANHVIGEMVGLIITQRWLTLTDEKCGNNRKNIQKEYLWLYETLGRLITPEGVYLENSANYTRLVCEFLVALDMFESSLGGINEKLRNSYLVPILNYINSLSYHGMLPNFGDNDAATVLIPFKSSFSDISPLHEYLKLVKEQSRYNVDLHKYSKAGHFLWKSEENLDLYFFVRAGNWSVFRQGAASHSHCDILSVLLFAKGIPVFVDKGCYYYNQSFDVRKECISTSSHNTITIEDCEQADYNNGWYNYPKSEILQSVANNCVFTGYVEYKDIRHTRSVCVEANVLTIIDQLDGVNDLQQATLNYILHESVVPIIVNNNTILLSISSGYLAKVIFSGINIDIVDTAYYPHYATKCITHALRGSTINKTITTKILFYE